MGKEVIKQLKVSQGLLLLEKFQPCSWNITLEKDAKCCSPRERRSKEQELNELQIAGMLRKGHTWLWKISKLDKWTLLNSDIWRLKYQKSENLGNHFNKKLSLRFPIFQISKIGKWVYPKLILIIRNYDFISSPFCRCIWINNILTKIHF